MRRKIWNAGLNILGIGENKPEPEEMPLVATKMLTFFSVALGVALIASNLAALKIWGLTIPWPKGLFPIKEWDAITLPIDAGIWLFPLSYVIGDLLINTYGEKLANLVAVYSALFAVIVAVIFWFAKWALKDFPGVDNSAFEIMQSAMGRIFLASVAGFLAGQIVNNYFFALLRSAQEKLNKKRQALKEFRQRALISSILAHFVDSLIFETLAFWERVSAEDFMKQVIVAIIAAFGIEALLSWKLTPWIAIKLEQKLKYSDGKRK